MIIEIKGKPVHVRPSLYAMYFETLKSIALDHGYNLCIHGSMNRDFDLVAFPWVDSPKPHFDMMQKMCEAIGGRFNVANNEGDLQDHAQKIGYCINVYRNTPFTDEVDKEYYFDIAIFTHIKDSFAVQLLMELTGSDEQVGDGIASIQFKAKKYLQRIGC